jgi:Protein of unknown function (DUF3565)
MQRAIVGYHQDDDGDWVAELACGHQQHVRHQPPWQLRPWAVDEEGRQGRLGTPLECRLCAQDVSVAEAGGEAACLAHVLCPECGAVLDGSPHRTGCTAAA